MRFTALYAVGALATLAPFVAVACEGTSFSVHDDGGTTVTPNDGSPPTGDDTAETDSSPAEDSSIADAAVKPSCRRSAPFGPPVRVLGLPDNALQLRLLPDELTGYYVTSANNAVLRVTRATLTSAFGPPETLTFKFTGDAPDAAPHGYISASLTADDSTLYLAADFSIYRTYRDGGVFGNATRLPFSSQDGGTFFLAPEITPDGTHLFHTRLSFAEAVVDNVSSSVAADGAVSAPTVTPLGFAGRNAYVVVSVESQMAYFATWRTQDAGVNDPPEIWSAAVSFPAGGEPQFSDFSPVTELNSPPADRYPPALSADGCRFYFTGPKVNTGAASTYVAERPLQ